MIVLPRVICYNLMPFFYRTGRLHGYVLVCQLMLCVGLVLLQPMWVFDDELDQMVSREITYVPGLYKIFDEILGGCHLTHWSKTRFFIRFV